jgi:hypothetical protein
MLGAAAAMLLTGGALPQPRLDQTQLSDAQAAPADVRMADGKVVGVERRPNMVTMLKLDIGIRLTVPPEGSGPGERAQVGDSVVARYVDNGRENIATLVHVIEMQAP